MNKISQSTLLKAILPFGACIGFDGTVHFFSDESDVTGLKKTVPDNASKLFDSTIFNEIKNIAQQISACG
jgi:hypothetical protein